MYNRELISKDFKLYEDIDVNFKKSIGINPLLIPEIEKVYSRSLTNDARLILGNFHLNIFKSAETILKNKDEEYDLIFDLSDFIKIYFDKFDKYVTIKNFNDLENFKHIIKIVSIIMKDALESGDIELIYEACYHIDSKLKSENLLV